MAVPVVARIALARARLVDAGLNGPDAGFDAEVLARFALGWSRADLLTRGREPEPETFPDTYERLVSRRVRREPVAYITGQREFWGLDFEVAPGVLIPRPETELLVEQVIARHQAGLPCRTIADVGTGSGCIAVAIATVLGDARVVALDCSAEALAIAARNAARHASHARITLLRSDLLTAVRGPFDVVVSNPPYVRDGDAPGLQPEVGRFEPAAALFGGRDGLDIIRSLCRTASAVLAPGGVMMLEFGAGQVDAVAAIAGEAGWADVRLIDDLAGIARVAVLADFRGTGGNAASASTEAL